MKHTIRLRLAAALSFAILLLAPLAQAVAAFPDVPENHPNFTAINALQEQGVIGGYPDGTFRPDNTVNRAEILKIVLLGSKVLVPEIQKQTIFPDVDSGAWYGKYVSKAKNLGIVKGDESTGLYRPGDNVNLAEALKILLKTNTLEPAVPTTNPYADVPKDAWFAPYFSYAKAARLLDETSTQNVNPGLKISRAKLAEIMYRFSTNHESVPDGTASFYGAAFHGKTTASGDVFDASALTAAHRTYAFNTWLLVTNTNNGKSVVVRVNDRGPYVSDPNRIIDLSQAAFEKIASFSSGVIPVRIAVTEAPTDTTPPSTEPSIPATGLTGDLLNSTKTLCPETKNLSFIPVDTYQGITLSAPIPNRALLNEVLRIEGSTSSRASTASAFLVDSAESQTSFSSPISSGRFSIDIRFPKEGTFKLGLLLGDSGSSLVKDILVLKNTCIEEVESQNLPIPSTVRLAVEAGDTVIRWDPGTHNLFKVSFQQGGLKKSYILHNTSLFKPFYRDFSAFQTGSVNVYVRGATLSKTSILEPAQILWSPAVSLNLTATQHREYILDPNEIELTSLSSDAIVQGTIKAVFKAKVPVRSKAAVILPSGKVQEITLKSGTRTPTKNAFDIEVFPASSDPITLSLTAQETALHILEVNNAEGLAVLNVPIYARNQYPLTPNPRDLKDAIPVDLGTNTAALRSAMLGLVNKDRTSYNLNNLVLDDSLSKLAQYRSDDMVTNNYFGHWDSQGRGANDFRMNYGIQTLVAENLAKDITLEFAEYGLMQSAIHRSNILSTEWKRVGFGISKTQDGSYIFVQLFSTNPLSLDDLPNLRSTLLSSINVNRTTALSETSTLDSIAQTWSQRMADENFFNFTGNSAPTLEDSVRDAGITSAIWFSIMGNSSLGDATKAVAENTKFREANWKKIGIGVKQDKEGILKITFVLTE